MIRCYMLNIKRLQKYYFFLVLMIKNRTKCHNADFFL